MITLHLTSLVYRWNTQKSSHMSISSLHLINAILDTPQIRIDTSATQEKHSLRRHEAIVPRKRNTRDGCIPERFLFSRRRASMLSLYSSSCDLRRYTSAALPRDSAWALSSSACRSATLRFHSSTVLSNMRWRFSAWLAMALAWNTRSRKPL